MCFRYELVDVVEEKLYTKATVYVGAQEEAPSEKSKKASDDSEGYDDT